MLNVYVQNTHNIRAENRATLDAYFIYRVSQELRSIFRGLITELMLSQKRHIHTSPIRNGSGVMGF